MHLLLLHFILKFTLQVPISIFYFFTQDAELSTIESELSDLRGTVDDQRLTIEHQDKKIIDLLQKQEADDKTEQYVLELREEIRKEREVVVEKDNEIQALLEKLEVKRTQGDGEDAESKLKKVCNCHLPILTVHCVAGCYYTLIFL